MEKETRMFDSATAAEAVRDALYQTPGGRRIQGLVRKRGIPIYLTGGFVRDVLLNQKETHDLDFSVKADPLGTASFWAGVIGGSTVPLDPGRGTFRVAKKIDGLLWYWDFTIFRGKDILADLSLRDFTINSMALPLCPDSEDLLDPTGGLRDLEDKIIRHTHPDTFKDDPVRILRAYRFSAQLDMRIDTSTRQVLGSHDLTNTVSGERIREELSSLLSSVNSAPSIKEVINGKLLESLWPEGGPNLIRFVLFENFIEKLPDTFKTGAHLTTFLNDLSTHGLSMKVLLKLLCLAIPEGKTLTEHHREIYRSLAQAGKTLVLGRGATRFQKLVLDALITLDAKQGLFLSPEGPWNYFDLFGRAGIGALALFTVFGGTGESPFATLDKMAAFYNDIYLPDLKKAGLISAGEISRLTGTKPGPELGELLRRLNMARRLGQIRNAREAEDYLKNS